MRDIVSASEIKPVKKELWKLTDTEITTRMGGYKYSIELEEIQTKRDVLMWVSHIAMKTWMTRQGIRQFAELLLSDSAEVT
jgi:hypothetical protein